MNLPRGFPKFGTRHKAEYAPTTSKTALPADYCESHAKRVDWQIVGLITALILSGAAQGIAVGLLLS